MLWLYNAVLQERIDAYRKQKISITYGRQSAQLPAAKEVFPELHEVYSQVLQDTLCRLDKAFKAFALNILAIGTYGRSGL